MPSLPIIYIVDDDPDACRALTTIVDSMKLRSVVCCCAKEFLALYDDDTLCCLVTDLRMEGMSGLELLRHLRATERLIPTVIITGYGETPVAVDAMHAGAVTFLEKTAPRHQIVEAISQALKLSERQLQQRAENEELKRVWQSFTPDERKLLFLVAEGKLNKEIAFELGSPLRTIEDRRRRLMAKIGAASIVDLVRFAIRIEQIGQQITEIRPWSQPR